MRLFLKGNYSDSAKPLAGNGLIYVIYSRLLYTSNLVSAHVGAFDTIMWLAFTKNEQSHWNNHRKTSRYLGENLIQLNVMGTLSGEIPFCRMQSILAYFDFELNLCFKSDFDLNSIISSNFVGRGRGLPVFCFFLITVVLPV